MEIDTPRIKAELAKLTNSELNALVWATKDVQQVAPAFLAWLAVACNWEMHRRVGLEYRLQSSETVDTVGIEAAIDAIKLMFGQGGAGVGALLDALAELPTGHDRKP